MQTIWENHNAQAPKRPPEEVPKEAPKEVPKDVPKEVPNEVKMEIKMEVAMEVEIKVKMEILPKKRKKYLSDRRNICINISERKFRFFHIFVIFA